MSAAKHTPGAWYTRRDGYSTVYVFSRIGVGLVQEVAACGPTNEGSEQQKANACLIAAAPELLAFARQLLADYRSVDGMYYMKHYAKQAGELVAKATGEGA